MIITPDKLTPQDLAKVDAAYWAVLNKLRLQGGIFTLSGHEYQLEPLQSLEQRICYMKATQGGFTEIEVIKTLWGMIMGKYPNGVLYLFPTIDDVRDFGKSRFNPLIQSNPSSIGKYVRNVGKQGTDNAVLKKIKGSYLYLRGAGLGTHIGDQKESGRLRSVPVDKIILDETDVMDDTVMTKARMRMMHSDVQAESYVSNPTMPDRGIDVPFKKSDQRHWFRRCACGHWTSAEISFPGCVKIRKDRTGYIGCDNCGEPVPMYPGKGRAEWVPALRDNSDYMHGYQWSQLSSNFTDPADILEDYTNPPQGNIADVYKLRLGLPYISHEDRLSESAVYACCSDTGPRTSHDGPCAMGVDVGKIKHVVIGVRRGKKQYEVLRTVKLSEWNDIHDIAAKFNVRSAVVDIRPYEDSARAFQKREKYRVFLCEYSDNSTVGDVYNTKTGILKSYRTGIMDRVHRLVMSTGSIVIPRRCAETAGFARQMCGTAKTLRENASKTKSAYVYETVGSAGDHFRHAMGYFILAASGARVAPVGHVGNRRQTYAINNRKVG